jgi:hypothetical protein
MVLYISLNDIHEVFVLLWNDKVGILVDKDDLINYQLLIIYGLLLRIFSNQPTVDKTILISTNCW